MPRVLSASELEENARALYRVGKYYDALTNIKEAVARASKPTPAQLELLIASQAKTEDHEGALQNSKALIRQYASEPAGYIRAAGILHKINRPQAALKIYERGLNTVPHNHASYPKMKEKHRELLASLTSATRTDPLTILPLEVVEMILQYLSFKQRVIIEHASMLKELRLNDWHSASDQLPIDFSRLTSLEHLEYGEGFEMPVNIPQSLTTLNQEKIPYLWTVSPTYICPHLRHVACHDLQTLKALLGEDGNVGASKLQSLKVSQLDPEETDWKTSPLLSDRLTELHELALLSSRKVDDGLVPVLIERMTKLEFIDLSYSDITGYGVKQLVANLPNLKKLLLKYCNDLSSDAVEWARTQRIKIEGASAWSIVGKSARSVRYGP
ncbi:hypothetical protein ANO11243_010650 [Dothideomycetidae sp. 11243]|nr:hypothetical protein ANO11243_010650 [fungal sp. No.11243]